MTTYAVTLTEIVEAETPREAAEQFWTVIRDADDNIPPTLLVSDGDDQVVVDLAGTGPWSVR